MSLPEPLVPASSRFDGIERTGRMREWFIASIVEQFEILRHCSSYYAAATALENVEILVRLGLQSAEIKRRGELIRRGYPK